ncbi:MAG: nucleotide modification associated domain-containing protein [Promethearchaeota archaeon]
MFKKKLALQMVKDIVNILEKKNSDYGNSFFVICDLFGIQSVVPRLLDKIFRIQSITSKKKRNFESLEDTFKDIIGYCILSLLYIKERGEPLLGDCGGVEGSESPMKLLSPHKKQIEMIREFIKDLEHALQFPEDCGTWYEIDECLQKWKKRYLKLKKGEQNDL